MIDHHVMETANDSRLLKHTLDLAIERKKKKQDSIFIVSGLEGKGKSYFSLWAQEYLNNKEGQKFDIITVNLNIKMALNHLMYYDVGCNWIIDEAPELKSKNSSAKVIKDFEDIVTIFRAKRYIVFINFPNPLRADKYLVDDRMKGLFFIAQTGRVYYFNKGGFFKLRQGLKHNEYAITHISSNLNLAEYNDFVPEYNGVLLDDYEKLKMSHIEKRSEELNNSYIDNMKVAYISRDEMSRMTNLKKKSISIYLQTGKIPYERRIGKRYLVRRDAFIDWVKREEMSVIDSKRNTYPSLTEKAEKSETP